MIFEKLADGITKHAKLVVIIWVIVLLASVYPALHASEHLSYSTSSMGGSDYESVEGSQIMSEHYASSISSETMAILLITYPYDAGADDATKTAEVAKGTALGLFVSNELNTNYSKSLTALGTNTGNGLYEIAITYEDATSKEVSNDTGNLRSFVSASMLKAKDGGLDTDGCRTYVTGTPAISYDASDAMSSDMAKVDPISILLILILVGLFFRSFVSSAAPPITIGVAFALVMCALFFIGQLLDIYYIVEMLLLVSMLGAGCDYCIFILSRYREERRSGLDHMEASRQAIIWAGESVFTSGIAVMIGFGSMMICDFNLVSTMGLGLAIGIVFALLAALTLMSSLVVLLGDRLFWPTGASGEKLERGYLKTMGGVAKKYFDISTRFSIKHAKAIIIATVLFTVPMTYVYATSNNSFDMIGAMMTGESQEGMTVMTDYVDGGTIMPNYAVIETEDMGTISYTTVPIGGATATMGYITWNSQQSTVTSKLNSISDAVAAIPDDNIGSVDYVVTWDDVTTGLDKNVATMTVALGAAAVNPHVSTTTLAAIAQVNTMLSESGMGAATLTMLEASIPHFTGIMDYVMLIPTGHMGVKETVTHDDDGNPVIPDGATVSYAKISMSTKDQAMADTSIASVNTFSNKVHEMVSADDTGSLKAVYITGTAAVMVEISNVMTEQFLKIEITAIILIIILLFFVMKSYLTPIRSVVTIFMSVIWTVAITHLLFNDVLHAGVLWILPIMLLVICLGLGMDYDILLTTRIREYHKSKGMSNDEAITQAVLHSGSVITICGLIMGGTFGTLMLSNTVMLQQMGFALCFAILVDALIVRTYIVPAAMHLMGDWNWKGPAFLQRNDHAPQGTEQTEPGQSTVSTGEDRD